MKKLLKFILGVGAIAGSVAGILYLLDKKKDEFEDFDDDDFDEVFDDEEQEDRDYVTLDIEKEQKEEASDGEQPEQE